MIVDINLHNSPVPLRVLSSKGVRVHLAVINDCSTQCSTDTEQTYPCMGTLLVQIHRHDTIEWNRLKDLILNEREKQKLNET